MIKWSFVLVFGLISIDLMSQARTLVSGKVEDGVSRESLPGASIMCKGHGTTSDGNGDFSLPAMNGDTLVITFVGYEKTYHIVTSDRVIISLASSSKKLTEVTVSADRIIAEEFTSKKLNKLDIYRNPSAKADPILAVNSMPYATTTDESANISLRGGSPDETGIFLNDVPINDAIRYSQLNGLGTFSIFNTAVISKVMVYPGNPPLEYGNSTSGVIALSTDEAIPQRKVTTLSLTLAGAGAYVSFKIDSTSSLTVFSNFQTPAAFISLNNKSIDNLKGFSSADIGIHYFKKFRNDLTLKVFNYSLSENYQYRYGQPTYSGIFEQSKRRNFTVSNVKKKFGRYSFAFNQGLSFSSAQYTYSTMDMNVKLNDYFGSFNVHRFTSASEWKTGLMYFYQASKAGGQYPSYYFAYGNEYPVTHLASSESVRTAELFGYYKKYFGNWIVGVGLRKSVPLPGNPAYLSYQGNIRYAVSNWKFIASAGSYNKYVIAQEGGGLLRSRQYSLDLQCEMSDIEGSISVFHKRSHKDNVVTHVNGLEIFSRYRMNSRLSSQLSLTSLNAFDHVGENKVPSPYNIHYFIRGNIEYKIHGTWSITLVYLFRQGTYYRPVSGSRFHDDLQVFEPFLDAIPQRLPSYNTIDMSVAKIFEIGKHITATAFASMANLIDFKNTRGYTYNFDYSVSTPELFSRRLAFFGIVMNF